MSRDETRECGFGLRSLGWLGRGRAAGLAEARRSSVLLDTELPMERREKLRVWLLSLEADIVDY